MPGLAILSPHCGLTPGIVSKSAQRLFAGWNVMPYGCRHAGYSVFGKLMSRRGAWPLLEHAPSSFFLFVQLCAATADTRGGSVNISQPA